VLVQSCAHLPGREFAINVALKNGHGARGRLQSFKPAGRQSFLDFLGPPVLALDRK
jgi:hypothetical protein